MKKLIFCLLLISCQAFSAVEVGTGLTSVFRGRIVPSMNLATSTDSWAFTGWSAGVQNDFYYHSAYGLHFFLMRKAGTMFGSDVRFGAGLGAMYSERGFQDLDSTEEITNSEWLAGPAFRVNWTFLEYFFVNFDATYGLRDIGAHLTLNFQDMIAFSIGARAF